MGERGRRTAHWGASVPNGLVEDPFPHHWLIRPHGKTPGNSGFLVCLCLASKPSQLELFLAVSDQATTWGMLFDWGHSLDPEAAAMGETLSIVRLRALSCWTRRRPVRPAAPVWVVAALASHNTETETRPKRGNRGRKQCQRDRDEDRHRKGDSSRGREIGLFLVSLSCACVFDCAPVARHTARPVSRSYQLG